MRQTLDVVMSMLHAFNRGDVEGMLEHCAPDVEFDWSRRLLDPVITHGHEEARRSAAELLESFEQVTFSEPEQLLVCGDDVLIVSTGKFKGRASGIDVEARGAVLWTVRDGKVVRFRLYQSLEDALEDQPQFRESAE